MFHKMVPQFVFDLINVENTTLKDLHEPFACAASLETVPVPIPITSDLDPMTMLTDDADVATWQNEGLPADRMSTENATILTNCERWPLVIDPQLQGINWIKNKYGEDLRVVRIGQR
eukprot:g44866.t1